MKRQHLATLGTMTTTWLSEEERAAWKGLSLMMLQLNLRLSQGLAASGLSLQDYTVLAHLADSPDGQRRVVELGRDLGWEKSRISHHIRRMAERGLVRKQPCPSDQRGSFVVITPTGRAAAKAAAPAHVAQVRELFIDVLSPTQLAAIERVAGRVLAQLAED
jgi:DNA-binding MarR family transcriptional regulator